MRVVYWEPGLEILGVDGCLRLAEPLYACKGYENCCQCPDCLEREAHGPGPLEAPACVCDRPFVDDGSCVYCGKAVKT